MVGNDTQRIIEESFKILNGQGKTGTYPELWDGKASERIVRYFVNDETLFRCALDFTLSNGR